LLNAPSNAWEKVTDWNLDRGPLDPDDYLYHVTSEPAAEGILAKGLTPNGGPAIAGRGGAYDAHSKGKAFLTDANGVNFWHGKTEDHLFDLFDDPPDVSILRIPKSKAGDLPVDELGTADARATAYYTKKMLGNATPGLLGAMAAGGGLGAAAYYGADGAGNWLGGLLGDREERRREAAR